MRWNVQDGNGFINRQELRYVMLNLGENMEEEVGILFQGKVARDWQGLLLVFIVSMATMIWHYVNSTFYLSNKIESYSFIKH
jgi:hypothetical protein